jgi:signal transduction histidine kinase
VTADSLPPRTAAELGVEPKPAADVQLISDLLVETRRVVRRVPNEHPLRLDLDAIERAFGRHLFDERARAGVQAARARAGRLGAAAGRSCEAVGWAFASELFVCLAVERPWRARDAEELLAKLGRALGSSPESVSVALLIGALRAPQLLELPPRVALEIQMSMLIALSPVLEASLWVKDETGRADCIISVGETATTRRFRVVASRTLAGDPAPAERGMIVGIAVRRWQIPWAALVVRTANRDAAAAALAEAAEAFSPLLERELLLQRSATRERSLVTASERRLSRLGFDLHDGALQHVAALDADLRQLARESDVVLGPQIHVLKERIALLNRELRELAHSLEPKSLLRRPLASVIETEAAALRERTGIRVRTQIAGDFGSMTQSQKIVVIRVVQEAFSNIREHSNAGHVEVFVTAGRSSVDVQIEDDGDGFEVTRTLQDAAQRGRLGLVGGSERVRLLGGTFDIRSRLGGPTTIALSLPRWQPLAAEEPSLQLAY